MATKKNEVIVEGLKVYELPVEITFIEAVLGTLPNNKEVMRDYITAKSADAPNRQDEIDAVGIEEYIDKQITVFARDPEGNPFMFDYQWKGFFKEKCGFLRYVSGTRSAGLTAFKKKIDGLVFIKDRRNPITLPDELEIDECQRPLRAETAPGPRVALAVSEEIPVGATTSITVQVMDKNLIPFVKEWLEYGIFHGTGQWRNSSKGRFICDFGEVTEGVLDYEEYKKKIKAALNEEVALAILRKQLASKTD
jgi:hypothetical protein